MKQTGKKIYIAFFLVLCMIPSVGLALGGWEDSAENTERAAVPSLTEDGHVNLRFFRHAGEWFEDNFAWREELVTANAKLQAGLFGVSAQDEVILGTDGWLYYADSLNDFTGREQLSDRALFDIARSAKITQEYCSYLGADYLFVIAPNKATLYPEYMPSYLSHRVSDTSNRIRLSTFLEQEGVNALDLTDILEEEARRRKESPQADDLLPYLYHKRDSHWTSEGAAMASEAILDALGTEHSSFSKADRTIRRDFSGDLDRMLYPADVTLEEEIQYDPPPAYHYVGEVESTFDYSIQTVSDGAGISLLMYRDSFGNALLPFLAESYAQGYFSRATPYDVLFDVNQYGATAVIVENAERNLPRLAARAPVLQGLPSGHAIDEAAVRKVDAHVEVELEEANPYFTKVTGVLTETPEAGELILADPGDGILYEAIPVHQLQSGEESFVLYVPAQDYPAEAVTAKETQVYCVKE